MLGGFLAWLAEGGPFYVLHDPSMILSRYKRGRGRGIVAETNAGWTPVSTLDSNQLDKPDCGEGLVWKLTAELFWDSDSPF